MEAFTAAAANLAATAPMGGGGEGADSRPVQNPGGVNNDQPDQKQQQGGMKQRGNAQLARTGYSFEGLDGDDWKEKPFVKPDILKARDHYTNMLFEEGTAPVWGTGIAQLAQLGVGISLHFEVLRAMACYFLLASAVAVPIFAIAGAGNKLSEDELDPLKVSRVGIANVGTTGVGFVNGTITPWPFSKLSYTPRQASVIITACDMGYCLAFILLVFALKWRITAVAEAVDASVITASEYAIFVRGLPPDAKEHELADHFNNLYNLRAADWTFRSSWRRCFIGRKMTRRHQFRPAPKREGKVATPDKPISKWRQLTDEDVVPVLDARNSGDPHYLRKWVAEVQLATANGHLIRRYTALTGLYQRIREARARVKKLSAASQNPANVRLRHWAEEKLKELERRRDNIDRKYAKEYNESVVGAFVVFQCEESRRRCLDDYAGSENSWSLAGHILQPEPLRFRGKHRLVVEEAPDPSLIIWENMDIPSRSRRLRQCGVNIMMLLLLFISFTSIILAQGAATRFRANIVGGTHCTVALPAVAYNRTISSAGVYTDPRGLPSNVQLTRDATQVCPSGTYSLHFKSDSLLESPVTSVSNPDPCYNDCVNPASSAICSVEGSDNKPYTYRLASVVSCYCISILQTELAKKGLITGTQSLLATEAGLCGSVARDYVVSTVMIIVTAAITITINFILRSMMVHITRLEGHPHRGAEDRAVAFKTFIALFFNTSLLILVTNAALPSGASDFTIGGLQIFYGQYNGFEKQWHTTVGGALVLTLIINAVSPHAWVIFQLLQLRCRRLTHDRSAVTQQQLNARYTPPAWEMPSRAAVMLNTVFSCFMYASSNPVFLGIAAISFGISYLIDKWALLRLYQKPLNYDETMSRLAASTLPFAVIIHLLIGTWMYSEPTVLYSQQTFSSSNGQSEVTQITGTGTADAIGNYLTTTAGSTNDGGLNVLTRITRENTLPMFIMVAVIVGAWFLYATAGVAIGSCLARTFELLSGGRCCKARASSALMFNPPYTAPYALALPVSVTKPKLTKFEVKEGWRIVRDTKGFLVKIRVWPHTGVSMGMPHKKGERLLTWQVLALQGIASYSILANPRYSVAVRALEEARWKAEMIKRKRIAMAAQAAGKTPAEAAKEAMAATGGGSSRRLLGAATLAGSSFYVKRGGEGQPAAQGAPQEPHGMGDETAAHAAAAAVGGGVLGVATGDAGGDVTMRPDGSFVGPDGAVYDLGFGGMPMPSATGEMYFDPSTGQLIPADFMFQQMGGMGMGGGYGYGYGYGMGMPMQFGMPMQGMEGAGMYMPQYYGGGPGAFYDPSALSALQVGKAPKREGEGEAGEGEGENAEGAPAEGEDEDEGYYDGIGEDEISEADMDQYIESEEEDPPADKAEIVTVAVAPAPPASTTSAAGTGLGGDTTVVAVADPAPNTPQTGANAAVANRSMSTTTELRDVPIELSAVHSPLPTGTNQSTSGSRPPSRRSSGGTNPSMFTFLGPAAPPENVVSLAPGRTIVGAEPWEATANEPSAVTENDVRAMSALGHTDPEARAAAQRVIDQDDIV